MTNAFLAYVGNGFVMACAIREGQHLIKDPGCTCQVLRTADETNSHRYREGSGSSVRVVPRPSAGLYISSFFAPVFQNPHQTPLPAISPYLFVFSHKTKFSFTMAPYLQEDVATEVAVPVTKDLKTAKSPSTLNYEPGRVPVETHENYEHDDLKPRFPDIKWPALGPIPYEDKGLKGDPNFRNLLDAATDVFDYNPKIGTEIHGVKLAQLTDAQKNDLARLIAVRGVVFFRNQDDLDIDAQRELGAYFGQLHKHATTSVPRREGLEDVHVIFTEGNKDLRSLFTPTFLWHSDVSTSYPEPVLSIITY